MKPAFYNPHLSILHGAGHEISPAHKILDLGCGSGAVVQALSEQGYNIKGCDLAFKPGPYMEALKNQGKIKEFSYQPYILPFDDNSFDVIISDQVFEHVQNYDETLAELQRVLKPDGIQLHIFPSRLKPIESHVFIPFSSVFRANWWLYIWLALGLGKKKTGLSIQENVRHCRHYLDNKTNYLTAARIKDNFLKKFDEVIYMERHFLENSPNNRGKIFFKIAEKMPFVFILYRHFWSRIILVR